MTFRRNCYSEASCSNPCYFFSTRTRTHTHTHTYTHTRSDCCSVPCSYLVNTQAIHIYTLRDQFRLRNFPTFQTHWLSSKTNSFPIFFYMIWRTRAILFNDFFVNESLGEDSRDYLNASFFLGENNWRSSGESISSKALIFGVIRPRGEGLWACI